MTVVLVPPFLSAEPETARQSGILGWPAANRPASERVASLVWLCRSGEKRTDKGEGGGARPQALFDLPCRNSVSQWSAAIHVRLSETQERLCKRNTRPPHATCPPYLRTFTATYRTWETPAARHLPLYEWVNRFELTSTEFPSDERLALRETQMRIHGAEYMGCTVEGK